LDAAKFLHSSQADDRHPLLINTVVETEPNAPLTVVVNWAAGAPK